MTHLNNPSSCFPGGIAFFLLDLLTAPFYVRDVAFGNNHLQCRLTFIGLVSTQMLLDILWSIYDDLLQYQLQLGYIMPVCSGHDER